MRTVKVKLTGATESAVVAAVDVDTLEFGDLHIFEHWHLESKPALLIGMDVLGQLDTLVIDYGRSEPQVTTRP